jgi:hypothetical protein
MQPNDPSDDDLLEPLAEDGQTPFSPADPARDPDADADDDRQSDEDHFDDTRPSTDDGVEPEEVYEAGLGSAVNESEPNAGNTVVGYTKPDDINPS